MSGGMNPATAAEEITGTQTSTTQLIGGSLGDRFANSNDSNGLHSGFP